MALSVQDRVRAGAEWLDEFQPDWRDRIDPSRLDIRHGNDCVAGQVFHDRVEGVDNTNGFLWLWDYVFSNCPQPAWMAEHGFASMVGLATAEGWDWDSQHREFEALCRAWLVEITAG